MTLPTLTPEQRANALLRAAQVRTERPGGHPEQNALETERQ